MRKYDVTPVGLVITGDGKTAFVTLGHAAHVAVVDADAKCGYILVGKRAWGIALSRDEAGCSSPTDLGRRDRDDVRRKAIAVRRGCAPGGDR